MRACVSVSATALALAAIAAGCGSGSVNNAGTAKAGNSAGGAGTGGTGPTVCGPQAQPPAANGQNFPSRSTALAGVVRLPDQLQRQRRAHRLEHLQDEDDRRAAGAAACAFSAPRTATTRCRKGSPYGMMFAVYMGDKATFEACGGCEKQHRNRQGADELAHRLARAGTVGGGRGDRRRRGHGVRAHDGRQAVGRLRERREHAGGGDPQQRGVERQRPPARRQRQHGNRLNPSYFAPAYLPFVRDLQTAAG